MTDTSPARKILTDQNSSGCYEINEPATAIMREVFQRYTDGDTVPAIVKDLNSRGIRTYKNKPFDTSTIYRALRSHKYIGECSFGDVKFDIPQIVDNNVFDHVQDRLDSNRLNSYKYMAPVPFLFSGKIVCVGCIE